MSAFDVQHRDCFDSLAAMRDAGGVDLMLFSPPYPDARSDEAYGCDGFDTTVEGYGRLGDAVFAALKPGGVCALNIDGPVRKWRDVCPNPLAEGAEIGSERSLIAFEVALDWAKRVGFRYVERSTYRRNGIPISEGPRWRQSVEILHVFSRPGTAPYFDRQGSTRPAKHAGETYGGRSRDRHGLRTVPRGTVNDRRCLNTSERHLTQGCDGDHEAPFASTLADDYVLVCGMCQGFGSNTEVFEVVGTRRPTSGPWGVGSAFETQTAEVRCDICEGTGSGRRVLALALLADAEQGFDVHAARELGERMVAMVHEQTVFEQWCSKQRLGPENRERGAFVEPGCWGCCGLTPKPSERAELRANCDCGYGGWPGKLAREYAKAGGKPSAAMGRSLARQGQRLLDTLEGQPSACQGECEGKGWLANETKQFCGRRCQQCHGTGRNLRGVLPAVEWSPQVRRGWAEAGPSSEFTSAQRADAALFDQVCGFGRTRTVPRGDHREPVDGFGCLAWAPWPGSNAGDGNTYAWRCAPRWRRGELRHAEQRRRRQRRAAERRFGPVGVAGSVASIRDAVMAVPGVDACDVTHNREEWAVIVSFDGVADHEDVADAVRDLIPAVLELRLRFTRVITERIETLNISGEFVV